MFWRAVYKTGLMAGIIFVRARRGRSRADEAGGQDDIYASGLSAWCLSGYEFCGGCGWRWMTMARGSRRMAEGQTERKKLGSSWAGCKANGVERSAGQATGSGRHTQGRHSSVESEPAGRGVWRVGGECVVCVCVVTVVCVAARSSQLAASWRTRRACVCCSRSASCGVCPAGQAPGY